MYNAPTIIECQSDLIAGLIAKAEDQGAKTIETTQKAEDEWASILAAQYEQSLGKHTQSWWTRSYAAGGKVQSLSYNGGIMEYEKLCQAVIESNAGLVYKRCDKA